MVIMGFKPAAETLETNVRGGAPTSLLRSGNSNTLYNVPTQSASLTHAGAYVAAGANGARRIQICVYSSANVLLRTATITPATGVTGVVMAEFTPPLPVSDAETYRLASQIDNGNLQLVREVGASVPFWIAHTPTPEFGVPPATFVDGSTTGLGKTAIWVEDLSGNAGLQITDVVPEVITPTSTPTIHGSGFGVPAAVLLSPTNDRTNVAATVQTIGAGAGDTTIPTTGVVLPVGTVVGDTLWYFVQAEDLTWSAGFSVVYSVQPTLSLPEVFTPTLNGFSFRFTTDTGNGTAIWAAYATMAERNAATVASIQAEIAVPNISLARGQFTVTTAGVQTVTGVTGLGAAQTRWVGVFHDGDVTA